MNYETMTIERKIFDLFSIQLRQMHTFLLFYFQSKITYEINIIILISQGYLEGNS